MRIDPLVVDVHAIAGGDEVHVERVALKGRPAAPSRLLGFSRRRARQKHSKWSVRKARACWLIKKSTRTEITPKSMMGPLQASHET